MTRHHAGLALLAFLVCTCGTFRNAQGVDWIAETGSYSVDENWASGFVPDQEVAAITNGGTAILDDAAPEVTRLRLGNTDFGGHGSLEILDGGELFADQVEVGGSDFNAENGFGLLRIHRGGELIATTLSSEGESGSAIVLGDVGGSGTATLAVDERATLARHTRIIGPHVEFTSLFLDLAKEHRLTAEITGPEHSTIQVLEDATLNDSSVHVVFNGHTPAFGASWTLLDAFTVAGEFGAVTASGLPPGAGVFLSYGAGGENGEIVDVTVGTRLALSVDRRTGVVAIENRAATESVSIQGYTIDGVTAGTSSSPATLAPESSIDLGTIYEFTPAAIGEEGPMVAFEYEVGGDTIQGRVDFTGPQNNVVLLVDPETGNAAIQNQSAFDAEVNGYLITSPSGSLDAEAWSSLNRSGLGGWTEANPSSVHLAELNLQESLALNASSSPISIGSPFDVDAAGVLQDLDFKFHLTDGETIQGVVEYGALDLVNPLDCNGDGIVNAGDLECILRASGPAGLDALIGALGIPKGDLDGSGDVAFADFLIMSSNFGTMVDSYTLGDVDGNGEVAFADFLVLSTNFGQSTLAAASVPEPLGWRLLGLGLVGLLPRRARRPRGQLSAPRRGLRTKLLPSVVLVVACLGSTVVAQTLTPTKQIFVSDSSDRDMINADMNPGPLDDSGDIVARERRTITQDDIQIRTFMEFDLSSITAEAVANPGWSAQFVIDFVTRLNTVNDMTVVVGRVLGSSDEGNVDIHPDFESGVLGGPWTTEPGQLPLFEWGRTTGESTAPDFEEDRFVVVENVKTDPLETRQVDVTAIVANWVTGVHENNGFSIAGGHDEFQGAGLNNARLIVGIAGDFDGNGVVDLGDFQILADNFASEFDGTVTAGDIDFDGDVDLDDFGQFRTVFLANAGQAQAVPEGSGMSLALLGWLGLLTVRRHRHRSLRDRSVGISRA